MNAGWPRVGGRYNARFHPDPCLRPPDERQGGRCHPGWQPGGNTGEVRHPHLNAGWPRVGGRYDARFHPDAGLRPPDEVQVGRGHAGWRPGGNTRVCLHMGSLRDVFTSAVSPLPTPSAILAPGWGLRRSHLCHLGARAGSPCSKSPILARENGRCRVRPGATWSALVPPTAVVRWRRAKPLLGRIHERPASTASGQNTA